MEDLILLIIFLVIPGALLAFAKEEDKEDYKSGRQKKQYGSYKGQRYTKDGKHTSSVGWFLVIVFILGALLLSALGAL